MLHCRVDEIKMPKAQHTNNCGALRSSGLLVNNHLKGSQKNADHVWMLFSKKDQVQTHQKGCADFHYYFTMSTNHHFWNFGHWSTTHYFT